MPDPKILTLDIETSPIEAYAWGIWEQNISLDQVKQDWSILAFAAKWLHAPEVIYADTGGRGKTRVRDDRRLLKQIWALLDEADIVVAQNGKAFDLKKINARLIEHGFPPYSPIRVVDTMLVARRHFAFSSNKLAFLTSKLTKAKKLTHKKYPGFSLWLACLADDPEAWKEMQAYNQMDVVSTEELYLKLRPWTSEHPNMGAYIDTDKPVCPKCGSKRLQSRGWVYSATGKHRKLRCQDCNGFARVRRNTKTPPKATN